MKEAMDRALEATAWRSIWKDAGLPTEAERQRLARLMYLAFCDLRILAREGKSEQARALAEAFHNVPLLMYSKDFSFSVFRSILEHYQATFKGNLRFNYLHELEKFGADPSAT